MSKIKNYVKATAYKVAVLLDLVDDNQKMKDGTSISLVKEGNVVNETNVPINLVFNKNDDGTSIFVDGFLNNTEIYTTELYSTNDILQNSIEIASNIVHGLKILFNEIVNAPANNLTDWDTFFNTSSYGNTGFTSYNIFKGNHILVGPSALTLKNDLFINNTAITSIIDDSAVKSTESGTYETGVFFNCTSLLNVSLSDVTIIGDYSFYNCTLLTAVDLPQVLSIGLDVFEQCYELSSVNLPLATSIGEYAFYNCTSLSELNLPEVIEVGYGAFSSCSNLNSIYLPSATSITSSAFISCAKLTSISLPNVSVFGNGQFQECIKLTSVDIPLITSIENYTFYNCTSLYNVSTPKVSSIKHNSFNGCASLSAITLTSLTSIEYDVFKNCTALSAVSFPNLETVGDGTFRGCIKLNHLNLSSCTTINGSNAFSGISGNTINLWIPLETTGSTGFGSFFENNTVILNPPIV